LLSLPHSLTHSLTHSLLTASSYTLSFPPPPQEPALYTGSSVYDRQPDNAQCCVAVAFKGAAWTDPDSIPLMVMQTLLGGWDRNNTSGKHAGVYVCMYACRGVIRVRACV
jgi:hypothetical protein